MSDTIEQIQDLIVEYGYCPENWDSLKFAEEIDKLSKGEVVELLKKCDGELQERDNKWFATFEMPLEDWERIR